MHEPGFNSQHVKTRKPLANAAGVSLSLEIRIPGTTAEQDRAVCVRVDAVGGTFFWSLAHGGHGDTELSATLLLEQQELMGREGPKMLPEQQAQRDAGWARGRVGGFSSCCSVSLVTDRSLTLVRGFGSLQLSLGTLWGEKREHQAQGDADF